MKITQLLRPNGTRQEMIVDLSYDGEQFARKAKDKGIQFFAEMAPPGVVYLSAEHPDMDDIDIANRIVKNGPEVIEALESMVKECADFEPDETEEYISD